MKTGKGTMKLAGLLLALGLLAATPALAGAKKSCREKCNNYITMCTKKCRQGVMGQGGSKNSAALEKCKQVCGKYLKQCLKRCESKRR